LIKAVNNAPEQKMNLFYSDVGKYVGEKEKETQQGGKGDGKDEGKDEGKGDGKEEKEGSEGEGENKEKAEKAEGSSMLETNGNGNAVVFPEKLGDFFPYGEGGDPV
jgi:hypothetical protein